MAIAWLVAPLVAQVAFVDVPISVGGVQTEADALARQAVDDELLFHDNLARIDEGAAADLRVQMRLCRAEVECIDRALGAHRVAVGLILLTKIDPPPSLVSVQLFRQGSGRVSSALMPLPEGAKPTAQDLRSLISKVLAEGAIAPTRGQLRVRPVAADRARLLPTPVTLTLLESGAAVPPKAEGVWFVPPGAYEVSGRAPGFEGRLQLIVAAGATQSIELPLVAATEPVVSSEETSSIFASPWFWVSLGLGVIAAGTAIGVGVAASSPSCLCFPADSPNCGCP